jgi:hypothetical protein
VSTASSGAACVAGLPCTRHDDERAAGAPCRSGAWLGSLQADRMFGSILPSSGHPDCVRGASADDQALDTWCQPEFVWLDVQFYSPTAFFR